MSVDAPAFDKAAIERHAELIHVLAEGLEGDIIVTAYGEDPQAVNDKGKPGRAMVPFVRRYRIGDIEGTVAAIMSQQGRPHANVYMPWAVLAPSSDSGSRGEKEDVVANLALVADMDSDKGTPPRPAPIKPSLVIESSPGNFQHVFIFDKPVPRQEAETLAKALQRATNSDSGTGDIAKVWRVPGALNWPNAVKLARGRPKDPVPVRVARPWDGTFITVEAMRAALAPWLTVTNRAVAKLPPPDADEPPIVLDSLPRKMTELVRNGTRGDRSTEFFSLVTSLYERGHSNYAIFDLLEEHPDGIAAKYGDRLAREVDRVCEKALEKQAGFFEPQPAIEAPEISGSKSDGLTFGFREGSNEPVVSEDEAGIQFAEAYRGRFLFCTARGRWFVWNGNTWEENTTALAFHRVREHIRNMTSNQVEKVRIVAGRASFAGAVERYARADPTFAVTAEAWDRDPYLLGTPGGTVDLRTGKLRASRPEDRITRCTAVAPAHTANCPLWLKLLDETFGGDTATIRFFAQWCGYSLTGDTREQSLVFGHGEGGNGKGVTLNTVSRIAGTYATTAASETFVAAHGTRHSTELAMLAGARIVKASETEEGQAWAEKRIKELTGGDEITARFMRQDNFTFLPAFKLTIIGNSIPDLNNVDQAMRRRFNLLPFLHKPAQPDIALMDKLVAEWPAILRWMLDGCLDWQANGLIRPASVRGATQEYFEAQDTFGHWISESCTLGTADLKEASVRLFMSWSVYTKALGAPAGTEKSFAQRLRQRLHLATAEKIPLADGRRVRGFSGIALRAPSFEADGPRP